MWNRDGSVRVNIRLRFDRQKDRGSIPDRRFSLLYSFNIVYGTYPTSFPLGFGYSFPDAKPPDLEANHSPAPNAEVKNA
jgi:hypothetical protein